MNPQLWWILGGIFNEKKKSDAFWVCGVDGGYGCRLQRK
jgi:hypothetical protein